MSAQRDSYDRMGNSNLNPYQFALAQRRQGFSNHVQNLIDNNNTSELAKIHGALDSSATSSYLFDNFVEPNLPIRQRENPRDRTNRYSVTVNPEYDPEYSARTRDVIQRHYDDDPYAMIDLAKNQGAEYHSKKDE